MGLIQRVVGPPGLTTGQATTHAGQRTERAEITALFDRWTRDPDSFRLPAHPSSPGLPTIGRPRASVKSNAVAAAQIPRNAGYFGLVCDLDQTLIPAHDGDQIPKPFPGICALLHELQGEQISGRDSAGYTHYVTARPLDATVAIPEWLETHALPSSGALHSGPDAREHLEKALDKIRDISAILRADPGRGFVLFGDSSHVDPFVYRVIGQRFPQQVTAAFIHRVPGARSEADHPGLIVVDDYVDAALQLHRLGVLDAEAVRRVARSAELEGGSLSPTQRDKLSQI